MLTKIGLSQRVKAHIRKIGDYEVSIYVSDEVIPFSSHGKQWIKTYKSLVQTVKDDEEADLMGYRVKLTEKQINEQFDIIEKNIKELTVTGHHLFGGNKQLWYSGSNASSNNDIKVPKNHTGNVKKNNSLHSQEQPENQGWFKKQVQGAWTKLLRYCRGF